MLYWKVIIRILIYKLSDSNILSYFASHSFIITHRIDIYYCDTLQAYMYKQTNFFFIKCLNHTYKLFSVKMTLLKQKLPSEKVKHLQMMGAQMFLNKNKNCASIIY